MASSSSSSSIDKAREKKNLDTANAEKLFYESRITEEQFIHYLNVIEDEFEVKKKEFIKNCFTNLTCSRDETFLLTLNFISTGSGSPDIRLPLYPPLLEVLVP